MLSLLLPLLAGVVTRLALRPRGQGQNQPMTIDVPWWALVGGWALLVPTTLLLLAGPTGGNISYAFALIIGASVVGILIPEIFLGTGQAMTSFLSKPKNWAWLTGIAIVLYALFVDPEMLQGVFLLGMMFLAYKIILGMIKPPKKKGGGK